MSHPSFGFRIYRRFFFAIFVAFFEEAGLTDFLAGTATFFTCLVVFTFFDGAFDVVFAAFLAGADFAEAFLAGDFLAGTFFFGETRLTEAATPVDFAGRLLAG
jgi:hypothetical protein